MKTRRRDPGNHRRSFGTSRSRCDGRSYSSRPRRLGLELLEERRLLAVDPFVAPLESANPAAAAEFSGDGVVDLVITSDAVAIDTDGTTIAGYSIASAAGVFTGEPASNLGSVCEDSDHLIGGVLLQFNGTHLLGDVIGDEFAEVDLLEDLTFEFMSTDFQSHAGTIIVSSSPIIGVNVALIPVPTPSESSLPGAPLPSPIENVTVGSPFYLELWVQDTGIPAGGISGGTVDLHYTTSLADATAVVNLDFDAAPSGSIDEAAGLVGELGGGTSIPAAGVAPQWARMAYVEFVCTDPGEVTFELSPGDVPLGRTGLDDVLWEDVSFAATTLSAVVPGSAAGRVFDDLDRDGVAGNGEPGLEGWTVELRGGGDSGALQQVLQSPGAADGLFGFSIAALGDDLLVGDLGVSEPGAVYLFDGTTGELRQTYGSPAPGIGTFGRSVAAMGGDVLVGDTATTAVSLFDGATGELLQTYRKPTADVDGGFGYSVAAVEGNVLIGAPQEFSGGAVAGAAYLFDAATGDLLQTFSDPTPAENDEFGISVAALGNNVLVGARYDDTAAQGSGAVFLFDGTNGELLRTFLDPTPSFGDQFGHSIASMGNNVFIGAPFDAGGGENAGAAYLFDAATGELLQTFFDPTPTPLGQFGYSVAASGDEVLVGACLDQVGGVPAGSAYLFDAETGDLLQAVENPLPGDGDQFGCAVAVVDDRVAVGAYRQNDAAGAAYLFQPASRRDVTLSDADGRYSFDSLLPGAYHINQVVPDGYTQTLPEGDNGYTITIDNDEHRLGLDFGNVENHRPVAVADDYRMDEDALLVIAEADGVLANDNDDDNDDLTAVLATPPSHATVMLESDGSFTYAPDADFFGTDTFTYRANDGVADSSAAVVTITVDPIYESRLSGVAFDDLDRDGTYDPGEPGLPDWTVQLQQVGKTDTPIRTFENPTPDEWSQFGRFVAAVGNPISGQYNVLIGSHYDDLAGPADSGAAYLYDGSTGELLHTLLSPEPAEGDKFGRAVASVGNNVLVGAPLDDTAAIDSGAVYLFDGKTGMLLHSFFNPTPRMDDQFGRAVAAVGDNVLVGARFADVLSEDGATVDIESTGAAFLFDVETGNLLQTFYSPTPSENAQFGYSVASMGDNVLIGARLDETGAAGVGAVYLFDGATGNLLQSFLNPTQRATGEPTGFGRSVAAVGNNVLVAARWDDTGADGAGSAFLFDGATGELLHTFTSPTPFSGEEFGFCVAAVGNDVLVGARWDNRRDDLGDGSGGAVYLFDGRTGQLLQTIANPSPAAWDAFGISVAAFGEQVVVGTQTGNAVYTFQGVDEAAVTLTDADGNYSFTDLESGTYRIRQFIQEGYVRTLPGDSGTYTVVIEHDEAVDGLDFGNVEDEPPVAMDEVYDVGEDHTLEIAAADGVLANDIDANQDPLTVSLVNAPPHGTLSLAADGSFSYTPDLNFNGADGFTYRTNDGLVDSNLATATITVAPINDAPVAGDNGLWVLINTQRVVEAPGVLADDVDSDGDVLTASLVDSPTCGTVTLQPDGSYTYTPDPNYAGPDSFTYRAGDGTAESNVATVHITITIQASDSLRDFLRITELNYHPYPPTMGERALGFSSRDAFEFIELQNTRDTWLDLAGVRFTEGVEFEFLGETLLGSGEYALLVKDQAAFEARYGAGLNVLGEYVGDLHNSGERIVMEDPFERAILDFRYDDGRQWDNSSGWPRWADGFGSTLEVIDPGGVYGSGSNWRASAEYGGSPGTQGSAMQATVVINEVLTHSNLPLTDAVELHNALGYSVDISGWYLSESANNYKKFRIPDGTIIPAGGYVVFDEHDFNPGRWSPGAGGFAFDSAMGDDVWLTAADAEGNVTGFVDHLEFDAALRGESFGRWPNAEGSLYPMRSLTLGSENSGPRIGPLVFSEVMYHPPDPENDGDPNDLEYIEIYNPTTDKVDLTNWHVRGGIKFDFPDGHHDRPPYGDPIGLAPGETILVVGFNPSDTAALDAFYDYYLLVDPVQILGPYSGSLDNDGNTVRLMRPDYPPSWEPHHWPHVVEDEVTYDNEEPWSVTADGSGDSLHRLEVDQWGNDPLSWTAAAPSPGKIDFRVGTLAVTEINYHPFDPGKAELAVDSTFNDESFEFIELLNVAGEAVDLGGMHFTQGILFTFPEVTLPAGNRVVIVNDPLAFETRYGTGINVVGQYAGSLDNHSEPITLVSAEGGQVLSFSYSDSSPWPDRADGNGSTLELVDLHGNCGDGSHWRPSSEYGGSPGKPGIGPTAEVVINEVLVNVFDPAGDRIELYNRTGGTIDVGGWYLSDSGAEPMKFRIPDGTILEGYGYVVFAGADFNPTPDRPGFFLDGLSGGRLFLLEVDPDGRVTNFADQAGYGATVEGESFGRWPDGQGDLYPMAEPTLDGEHGENSGPRVGPVLISEVMYHPRDPGEIINPSDLEYIEVHNPTAETVDLTNWQIRGGVQFDFTAGTLLAPREALVVVRFDPDDPDDAESLDTFRLHYAVKPWVDIVGGYTGSLSNRGDQVCLLRAGDPPLEEKVLIPLLLEDEVIYGDEAPWPATADGFGYSLNRLGGAHWGNAATSWTAVPPSPGAVARPVDRLAITELNYHPYDPTAAELAVDPGFTSDDFEFVELLNVAGEAIDLDGLQLSEGITFEFPDLTLGPAQRVLVVAKAAAFAERYDVDGVLIAGQFEGVLADSEERITLADDSGESLLSFAYDNSADWPGRADGHGSSLEIQDLSGDYNDPDNWRSSSEYGGSPGSFGEGFRGDVVVNEVLAHSEFPLLEAIELHNTTDRPIDIGDWYLSNTPLSDSDNNYRKFRIPAPTVIPAHQYWVFDEHDFNPNGDWNPNPGPRGENEFTLNDSGGEIWLTEAATQNAVVKLVRFADHVEFGAASAGKTFGRWPDGSGDVLPLVVRTLGNANANAQLLESLVVTELNYNPHDPSLAEMELGFFNNDDFEFIELRNIGQFPFDLTGLQISVGISFNFSDGDVAELAPGQFVVVARNAAAFATRYGEEINVAGQYDRGLSNDGEGLMLANQFGDEVFVFSFDDSDDWPQWAAGRGASLELIDPAAVPPPGQDRNDYLNNPENWRSSGEYGGSPGAAGAGPRTDVVINEVLTHAEMPSRDAIELYNTSDQVVDVGGWYLSDSGNNARKFRIPDGSLIPDGGYLVFDEDDFNPAASGSGPNGFALEDAYGGRVWLVAADETGPTQIVDQIKYDAAAGGESFGRWPDGQGELYPMLFPTLGAADPQQGENSGPRVGPVIISELHYHSDEEGDLDDLEFVEIFNPTLATVDLTDWRIARGIGYRFAPGTRIGPYDTLVVLSFNPENEDNADRLADFRVAHGIDESVALVGGYGGRLSNGGEEVQLLRIDPDFGSYLLEDQVNYDDHAPWPVQADGRGSSLHRLGPELWGDAATGWAPAVPTPGSIAFALASQVTARHVFYNDSAFDGNSPAPNRQDDNAIATDKQVLLPGQTATFANYTSYSSGINGVMIDVVGLPDGVALETADFRFRVGNSNRPGNWTAAPLPSAIAVRPGEGFDGADRVTITWADGEVTNQWLEVAVLPTANTMLERADVFYIGNAIGEAGNSPGDAKVNLLDLLAARNNPRNSLNSAKIDFDYDYNRDQRVNATDMLIARSNQTHLLDALKLIAAPGTDSKGAHDAVMEQVAAQKTGAEKMASAKIDWLFALEYANTQKRTLKPAHDDCPAGWIGLGAIDE